MASGQNFPLVGGEHAQSFSSEGRDSRVEKSYRCADQQIVILSQ